jgi:NhaP-type Na+/H+ or K+/H+ antiporter
LPILSIKFLSISTSIGVVLGIFCCLCLKHIRSLTQNASFEITFTLMCGFISYYLGDWTKTSGVVCIIITGVIMSIYGYYNMSP